MLVIDDALSRFRGGRWRGFAMVDEARSRHPEMITNMTLIALDVMLEVLHHDGLARESTCNLASFAFA